jgi:putative transposase
MPRRRRVLPVKIPAHLVQRAVDRQVIFKNPIEFSAFLGVLAEAASRYPVELLGYCVMPNHWHLLAMSERHDGISRYMGWLTGTHAKRHRRVHGTIGWGHVYKERFWSDPVEDERHFFTVLRYIEANPKTAGLVERAEQWRWSSAWERRTGAYGLLAPLPAVLPENWIEVLNTAGPRTPPEFQKK